MNNNPLLVLLLFSILLTGCSQQSLMKLITKTPKVEYTKPNGFKSFSNYHKDAIYTVETIKSVYPRLYDKLPDFNKQSEQFIKTASQTRTEKNFDILLKTFISSLNDGHTYYSIDFSNYDKKRYALYLYPEKEKWIIGTVDKEIDSTLIGGTVISVNNIPISEIEQRIENFEDGENKYWKFRQFRNHYFYPTYWEALRVNTESDKKLKFEVKKEDVISTFTLIPKEKPERHNIKPKRDKYQFRFKQNNGFYDTISKKDNFAYLQMNTSLDYVSIKSEIGSYTNFLTKPIALAFLKKDTKDARDFGKYLQSFFKRVNQSKIENLIIDLSYNTGGDERTGKQLIWYLTETKPKGFTDYLNNSDYFKTQVKQDYKKYNELYLEKYQVPLPKGEVNLTEKIFEKDYFADITKEDSPFLLDKNLPKFNGKVFVITSPLTFSAGQILATTISDNNLATIVGKPTGNKPTTQTGASMFKLPKTKKIIAISYTFMERPDKSKNSEDALYPDVEIYHTYENFMNGQDKLMKYLISQTEK